MAVFFEVTLKLPPRPRFDELFHYMPNLIRLWILENYGNYDKLIKYARLFTEFSQELLKLGIVLT